MRGLVKSPECAHVSTLAKGTHHKPTHPLKSTTVGLERPPSTPRTSVGSDFLLFMQPTHQKKAL